MTALLRPALDTARPHEGTGPQQQRRRFLMCPPTHFDVAYTINPWMDPTRPVDPGRAMRQWTALKAAYEAHGHMVELITPEPGLPDMVYAANSALVLDGLAYLARFRHPQRRGEEAAYRRWFTARGLTPIPAQAIHEGEGDFAVAGNVILAATGFRTDAPAHAEAAVVFDRPVVSLRLIDPRFYHLDTALCVLDAEQVMYYPPAFCPESRRTLQRLYPDAIVAEDADALAFGLNATSDGHTVFLPAAAERLAHRLDQAGFQPVPIDLSELLRGGGSAKCCTLELRGLSWADATDPTGRQP